MNQSQQIVKAWNSVDNGSLNDASEEDALKIKKSMYDEVEKQMGDVLLNQKNPRATIRRAINSGIYGWKSKPRTKSFIVQRS